MRCGVGVTDTGPVNSTPRHTVRPGARSLRMRRPRRAGWPRWPPPRWELPPWCAPPHPGQTPSTPARKITVTTPTMPLSGSELVGLLDRSPDLGPLGDPARRASCLAGLGYPASTPVLGSRQVRMAGRDAVILVLAADAPRELTAVAVPGTCSAADTGLLADTTVRRP